jgi:hypothetical protein
VQADIEQVHGKEGGGQDERNRNGDDQAGAQAEADEGDQQDDGDRFGECADESLDGVSPRRAG